MPPVSTVTSPPTAISPSTQPCTSRSASPVMRPRTRVALPMMDAFCAAISHVHVDVALELGPVGDRDARGLHVADDARPALQVDALGRVDVARERARHDERAARHVGLDRRAVLDGDALLRGELAAHGARHDDVLVRRDLAFDRDARADDRARHGDVSVVVPSGKPAQRRAAAGRARASREAPPPPPPSSGGSSNSQSRRPEKRAPSSIDTALPRRLPRTREPATRRTGPLAATSPSSAPAMVTVCASTASLVTLAPSA